MIIYLLVVHLFLFLLLFLPSYFDLKEGEHFKKHTGYPKLNAKQGAVKHFFKLFYFYFNGPWTKKKD